MSRCYIVATGESLKGFNLKQLEFFDTIAVNYACLHLPRPSHIVALDAKFYAENEKYLRKYKGTIHSVQGYDDSELKEQLNVKRWPSNKVTGVDVFPFVAHGFNSGLTAIAIAIHLGFDDIRLMGFDCGGHHFYGELGCNDVGFNHMIQKAKIIKRQLPKHITITNYSEQSKCTAFKRKPLSDWNE